MGIRVHLFSDFHCPVCRRAIEPLKWLVRNSPVAGKVRFVFYNYALESHSNAKELAIASLAAARQNQFGAFWDTVDPRTKPDNLLTKISSIRDLDIERFQEDLKDPALAAQVDYERALAKELGLSGTPGICINGDCQAGWASYMMVESRVSSYLTKISKLTEIPPTYIGKEHQYYCKQFSKKDNIFCDLVYEGNTESANIA